VANPVRRAEGRHPSGNKSLNSIGGIRLVDAAHDCAHGGPAFRTLMHAIIESGHQASVLCRYGAGVGSWRKPSHLRCLRWQSVAHEVPAG